MISETLSFKSSGSACILRLFKDESLSEKDRAFILALYLGVLERLYFLDYNIEAYSNVPFNKIKPVVKNILRIALYQMYFMDLVPERAAVSEALKLAELRGLRNLKGFINGILRTIQREGLKKDAPDHIMAGVPEWMYEKVCGDIGKEKADEFFRASFIHDKTLTASLNPAAAPSDEIIKSLEADGCSAVCKDGVCEISLSGKIEDLKAFKEGYIYIQSANSMKAAEAAAGLCSIKDPFIIDVCASPGGKSIDLSFAFPHAVILSRDKSRGKINLIEENISRLKIKNIACQVYDAAVFDEGYEKKADIVIADVPCSGIGVISQKPDIRHRLKKEDIAALSALQRKILMASAGYVKEKGLLIYSTCTLTKEENAENTGWFEQSFDFTLEKSGTYTTYKERADGFYVAAFRKN